MNEDDDFDLHQIISEGNRYMARSWLQVTFLGYDVPNDDLLVDYALTKIETIGITVCEFGREALNQVYLLLDNMQDSCPEKAKLVVRWQALDDQYRCFA